MPKTVVLLPQRVKVNFQVEKDGKLKFKKTT